MWQTASGTEKHKSYTDRRIAMTKNGQKKLQTLPQYLYPLETDRPTVPPTPPPPASSTRKLDLSFCCIVSHTLYKRRRRRTLRSSAHLQRGPSPGSLDSRQNRLLCQGQIYQIVDSNPRQIPPTIYQNHRFEISNSPCFPWNLVWFQAPLWTHASTGYCRFVCQVKSTKSQIPILAHLPPTIYRNCRFEISNSPCFHTTRSDSRLFGLAPPPPLIASWFARSNLPNCRFESTIIPPTIYQNHRFKSTIVYVSMQHESHSRLSLCHHRLLSVGL